jgi:type II secretory pathway component PulK
MRIRNWELGIRNAFHSAFRIPHSELRQGQRGIALLIVVSMLTVVGIMGVAFAFSMFLETAASRQFVASTQARYIAESGVSHAWTLLDEDRQGSRIDEASEPWSALPSGDEVDVDDDGEAESRWWTVTDAAQQPIGRYAFKISDEAGKANLNAALAEPSSSGPGAIDLTVLLEQAKIDDAEEAARAMERYRYGDDERPGKAQFDDDGDGAIDEPEEYQPVALRHDDRLIESLEDLVAIAGLDAEAVARLSRVATVYSWDMNVSVRGQARVNVNTATAEELLAVLLEAGVANPWQVAVNIADYVDPDLALSRVSKATTEVTLTNQGALGSWQWVTDHYESEEPGGTPLSWQPAVPTGEFQILARGVAGSPIGDLTIAGVFKPSVEDGESLGVFTLTAGTPLAVTVTHQESAGTTCKFQGLELIPQGVSGGTGIRGIEAIRINELMVEPTKTLAVSSATFSRGSSDWACPSGTAVCSCSGVGEGRWTWSVEGLVPGWYHVRVLGSAAGQTVGAVDVGGSTIPVLAHGGHHPETALVVSDGPNRGKFSVAIGKTVSSGTYYLKEVVLGRQPDGEYLELVNLSDRPIDLSGWVIEGEATGGRQAVFPAQTVIQPHGLLVAVVDLDDAQPGLDGNHLDARTAWEIADDIPAVQLEFPGGAPSPEDDWLKLALPTGQSAQVKLLTADGHVVDEVEYLLPLATTVDFQSLEKGDPTVIVDQDGDGIDDGWFPSESLYTPGLPNDNEGLTEGEGLEAVVHDPMTQISIRNRPLEGIGELAGVASGTAWQPFSSAELAKIVDRLTVEGIRLEVEGRLIQGESAWAEDADGFYVHTDPAQADETGVWQWTAVPDGTYRFSVYGWPGEQFSVRWQLADGTATDWSPGLSTDAQGRVAIGEVTIGGEGTPANSLSLEAKCVSANGICHVDYVQLDPSLIRVGPVNINTAPLEVLRALPGMTDQLASRIIAGRPYGDREEKGRGIGDLLVGGVLGSTEEDVLENFQRLAHLLTVRSDLFQIMSLGQAIDGDRVEATQRIQTVIQRQ